MIRTARVMSGWDLEDRYETVAVDLDLGEFVLAGRSWSSDRENAMETGTGRDVDGHRRRDPPLRIVVPLAAAHPPSWRTGARQGRRHDLQPLPGRSPRLRGGIWS